MIPIILLDCPDELVAALIELFAHFVVYIFWIYFTRSSSGLDRYIPLLSTSILYISCSYAIYPHCRFRSSALACAYLVYHIWNSVGHVNRTLMINVKSIYSLLSRFSSLYRNFRRKSHPNMTTRSDTAHA